jgi:hypothetical protein
VRSSSLVLLSLVVAAAAGGQESDERQERARGAEALLERVEALSGRPLDERFRALAARHLARLAPEELERRQERAPDAGLGALTAPGDATRDLVYTPVTPCRVADTRAAGGSLPVGTARDLRVTGLGLQGQGGDPAGCGVPVGAATAAVINFVAVSPAGAGNLRAWPYSTPPGPPPNASIVNYAAVSGLNLANAVVVPLCDVTATTCPFDIRVLANGAGTHLVADVVGYFHRLDTQRILATATASARGISAPLPSACTNLVEVTVAATGPGTVLVTVTGQFVVHHSQGSNDDVLAHIADAPSGCASTYRYQVTDGTVGMNTTHTASFTRTFEVASAGTYTYYLNAMAANTPGTTLIENYQMFASYYPE